MATKTTTTRTVKAKSEKKTSAPKVSRRATAQQPEITYDAIAARAYERFCERGFEHGHDVEDWLAAETDLRQ